MAEKTNKKEVKKKDLAPLLKFFSILLVLRGLINLLSPIIWNTPWDEFFLGPNAVIILNILFIISGIGVFLGKDWGYFIALTVCAVAFVLQSDANVHERTGGVIMSLFMFIAFWNGWRRGKAEKTPRGKIIALVAILLLTVVGAYDYMQPSEGEVYDRVVAKALEKKDARICEEIGRISGVDQCIFVVARAMGNASICDMSHTNEHKRICYDYVT